MTDKTDTTALVIAEELNEWARDYAPTELATALATCAAVLLKNQNARIAELEALQAAPPAPAAVAVPAKNHEGYLPCPFCGSDQASLSCGKNGDGTPWHYVECGFCAACTEPYQWNIRTALAAAPAQAVPDTERLNWLEQHEDGYYNLDRVASIVGTGFLTGPLNPILQKAHATLREAIDSARGASTPSQEHATQLAGQVLPADEFRGDTASLVRNIIALLDLDAEGCLVPHGVGGHARGLLSAAASRLAPAPAQAQEDAARLDAMQAQRIAVIPEFEGPWDATIYGDSDEPIISASGNTPREAIDAARAAQGGAA